MIKKDCIHRGFTLLEVMIAMSIMAIVMIAILNSQSVAIKLFGYSDSITKAAILAKLKMSKLELEYKGKFFGEIPESVSGDFEEEGYPDFKWEAKFESDNKLSKIGEIVAGGDKGENENVQMAAQMAGLNPKIIAETLSKSIKRLSLTIKWERGLDIGDYTIWTHYLDENLQAIPGLPEASKSAGGSGGSSGSNPGSGGSSTTPNTSGPSRSDGDSQ
ncbi:MAG: prepilin-type N-terminal cleavage/methylation domain-containing protein [Pseudomonadota bacterium]